MLNTTIAAGFMGMGPTELIVIVVIVLLLFGGKKIPELMRGLGRGVKEFKDGKDGAAEEQTDPANRDKTV